MPAQSDGAPSRGNRWLLAVVVFWALLLAALAYLSVRHGEPTVREQRSIGEASSVVARAVGHLIAAAGGDVVTDVAGDTLDEGCRITPIRSGGTLTNEITFYTAEAGGPALLDRIAASLPRSYDAQVRHSPDGGSHSLRGDAGEFVSVRGRVGAPGVVTLTVSTGCRPVDVAIADLLPGRPINEEPQRVLTALDASGIELGRTVGAACPAGGGTVTAHATGQVGTPTPFADGLRSITAGATVVLDTPQRYVYRTPDRGVVVQRGDDQVRVSVTIPCPPA